ncbi:MAG: hypothetical protein K1X75_13220 [Leptospirales bacterium]|nr:hypothetical protein [Leptospirales bacterium]
MKLNEHQTLQRLADRGFREKRIVSALKKCRKKLSAKSAADLNHLADLAYELFLCGYDQEALAATGVLDGAKFAGDFNIWTPIEKCLLLQAWLHEQSGKPALAAATIQKISEPMAQHEEALSRRLSLDWLHEADIQRYESKGDSKAANETRRSDLGDLLFIWALGEGRSDLNGNAPPIAIAIQRFGEYVALLKNAK